MKDFFKKIISAGVIAFSFLASWGPIQANAIPANKNLPSTISKSNSPLILEHANQLLAYSDGSFSNMGHYSHRSHYSHTSHSSHASHTSHYSGY